jgi:fluoride exporter
VIFLVMIGGALGAGGRYLVSRATLAAFGPALPWGTLAVNLAGGLLMGLLVGALARAGVGEAWRLFLGVGVLGGFTTFSAFALETATMIERGALLLAAGYAAASVMGSIAALFAGLAVARAA